MAVRVQREDFDIGAEVRRLTAGRTDIGAIVTFTGTRARRTTATPIAAMTLEHYPGMTEAELARIEAEARRALAAAGEPDRAPRRRAEARRQHRAGGHGLGAPPRPRSRRPSS